MNTVEDFERICALRDVAAALPTGDAWWDLRELVTTMEDGPLQRWAVREIVPRIDPDYWSTRQRKSEVIQA